MTAKVVVIGAGPGGYQAAIRAAQMGAQVSLVEKAEVGGTCLHWGCIPTKSLKASADALSSARRLAEYGLRLEGEITPDLTAISQRVQGVVDLQTKGLLGLFKAHKLELLRGSARLLGPGAVEVALAQGGSQRLEAQAVILATGSIPGALPGLEPDGGLVWNSDHALKPQRIPPRLAVVGGGVVGCELACIYAALGSQVTVIEALERLLPIPSLDPEASKLLLREFKKQGIAALTGVMVQGWQPQGQGASLTLAPSTLVEPRAAGKPGQLEVDQILVAVGRKPQSQGLGLTQAGVKLDQGGAVLVDDQLATNLPGVYAVGDLLGPGRPMLAHMASAEGLAAASIALDAPQAVDYQVVPAVAFTSPEVAWVGLSPDQAQAQGQETVTGAYPFRGLGMAQALGTIAGQVKLVADKTSGRLLGASIIGHGAADLIHEFALALRLGAGLEQVASTIHAHPTLSEAVHEAAEAALGHCVHLPPPRV